MHPNVKNLTSIKLTHKFKQTSSYGGGCKTPLDTKSFTCHKLHYPPYEGPKARGGFNQ